MNGLEQLGINAEKPFFMIICGRSGSGKSHYLKYLMRELNIHNPFDYGIVMSNTSWEGFFSEFIPSKYIYENFNEDTIKSLIKLQKDNLTKGINKRAFLILDDCIAENEMKSPIMKKLSVMGRHFNLTTILTTQYVHLIPPVLRANSHYNVFFHIGDGVRELRSTYEAWGQKFKNYDEFKQFYYNAIKDHKFIMYNNEQGKYNIYRCPENIPSFKIKYNKKIKSEK